MKNWILGMALMVSALLAPNVYAGTMVVSDVIMASGTTTIAVAGTTAVVYTKTIDISDAEYFAVEYYANAGTVVATIQIEQSNQLPATQGAADANYTIPVNLPDIVTGLTTEETWYRKAINPIACKYVRFKISGASGNDAGSTLRMRFIRKQD